MFGAVGLNVVGVLMGVSAGFALGAFPPPVDIAILVVGVLCVRGGTELLRVVGDGSWLLGRSDDDQGGWGDDEPAPAPPDPILLRVTRISRAPVLR